MDRKEQIDSIRVLKLAKKAIKQFPETWSMPKKVAVDIIKSSGQWNLSSDSDEFFTGYSWSLKSEMYDYFNRLRAEIRTHRMGARFYEPYEPMKKHVVETTRHANNLLRENWSRCIGLNAYCLENGFHGGDNESFVDHEKTSDYTGKNDVYLKLTWNKTVFERGIAMVMAGSGKRFVMSAKRFDFDSIPETATAFKIKSVTWKKSVPTIEIGWLLVHNFDKSPLLDDKLNTLKVHAYGTNLQSAVQLLNRRTKAFVLDTLLDNL